MRSFDYARPHTLEEALDLLAAHGEGAAPLAGGTDLMVQMSKGVRATPRPCAGMRPTLRCARNIRSFRTTERLSESVSAESS